jgi:hypothetical protein
MVWIVDVSASIRSVAPIARRQYNISREWSTHAVKAFMDLRNIHGFAEPCSSLRPSVRVLTEMDGLPLESDYVSTNTASRYVLMRDFVRGSPFGEVRFGPES